MVKWYLRYTGSPVVHTCARVAVCGDLEAPESHAGTWENGEQCRRLERGPVVRPPWVSFQILAMVNQQIWGTPCELQCPGKLAGKRAVATEVGVVPEAPSTSLFHREDGPCSSVPAAHQSDRSSGLEEARRQQSRAHPLGHKVFLAVSR